MDDEGLASCEGRDEDDSSPADRREQMMRAVPSLVVQARAQFGLRPAAAEQSDGNSSGISSSRDGSSGSSSGNNGSSASSASRHEAGMQRAPCPHRTHAGLRM